MGLKSKGRLKIKELKRIHLPSAIFLLPLLFRLTTYYLKK